MKFVRCGVLTSCYSTYNTIFKGAGGLRQDFLEIDFLVGSDRGE